MDAHVMVVLHIGHHLFIHELAPSYRLSPVHCVQLCDVGRILVTLISDRSIMVGICGPMSFFQVSLSYTASYSCFSLLFAREAVHPEVYRVVFFAAKADGHGLVVCLFCSAL